MSYKSLDSTVTAQKNIQFPRWNSRCVSADQNTESNTITGTKSHPCRHIATTMQILVATVLLIASGCMDDPAALEAEKSAVKQQQLEEALARFPVPPPDTPEQIQQKIAQCEELLPPAEEALEAAEKATTELEKLNELDNAVDLTMKALYFHRTHRKGLSVFLRARLARYLATELDPLYQHQSDVDIRTAASLGGDMRDLYEDLSEEELQLLTEVYFNRARMEGRYRSQQEEFGIAIKTLIQIGFSDAERLKTEPRFEYFRTDPDTVSILETAIARAEAADKEAPKEDSQEETPTAEQLPAGSDADPAE